MFKSRKKARAFESIDRFFDTIDKSLLVFNEGVKNYLYHDTAAFSENLKTIAQLENEAETLRRSIESNLYRSPSMSKVRGDIMRLLEVMDHIIDTINNNLFQFEIEMPYIPVEFNADFLRLTSLSIQAVETTIPAAKAYFKNSQAIAEKIHRVYFYEKEADIQAKALKRKVFHDNDSLKLSQKFHLRYFALHIEEISLAAEKVADQLSVMSIKRGVTSRNAKSADLAIEQRDQLLMENRHALNEMQAKVMEAENDNLRNLLNIKRNEAINVAINASEQREFIDSIHDRLSQAVSQTNPELKDEMLHSIMVELGVRGNEVSDMDGFYSEVEGIHEDFTARLLDKYPSLTLQERRLATLLRLEFSSKYIAMIMNITPKSVEIARHRLRVKLGLTREQNLTEFIKNI